LNIKPELQANSLVKPPRRASESTRMRARLLEEAARIFPEQRDSALPSWKTRSMWSPSF
jgi:hypothetical protein